VVLVIHLIDIAEVCRIGGGKLGIVLLVGGMFICYCTLIASLENIPTGLLYMYCCTNMMQGGTRGLQGASATEHYTSTISIIITGVLADAVYGVSSYGD
jgi:hypothetical protein